MIEKKVSDKNIMFRDEIIARHRYNFIFNKFISSLLDYDVEKSKALKELLSDIKSLSENHGSKINFSLDMKKE